MALRDGASLEILGAAKDFVLCLTCMFAKSSGDADMRIDFSPNYDIIALKTAFDTPPPFEEAAVAYIFNTERGNFAFLGDTLCDNAWKVVGENYRIDLVSMGNNAPGYTDKMSPWDLWRVAESLNAAVISNTPTPHASRRLGQLLRGSPVPDRYSVWKTAIAV